MARVTVDIPERFQYQIELPIMLSHINRGDHLSNDSIVAFLNEARGAFLIDKGVPEYSDEGAAMINADLAVVYKSEARHGERLLVEVAAQDFNRYGCDIVYRISEAGSGRLIALAKTAHLHYDPEAGALLESPPDFRDKLMN